MTLIKQKKVFTLTEVFSPHPTAQHYVGFTLAEVFYPAGMSRKIAFTLAEVLITLGIIGVVAALTIPTLIQQHKKSTVETKLKKFYTTMNQAILRAKNDFGDYQTWDFAVNNSKDTDNPDLMANQSEKIKLSFEKYLKPYLNIVDVKEVDELSSETFVGGKNYLYYFSDGTSFKIAAYNNDNYMYYTEAYDKCKKRDQSQGVCEFRFAFRPNDKTNWPAVYNKGFEPYKYKWDGVDNNFLQNGCSAETGSGAYCTTLIQLNGWHIPNDYPFKL